MDRSWLIHESPGLKPDWLGDIKLFSVKNSYMLLYNILSNIFQQQEAKILDMIKRDLKINSKGLQIETLQIFIIRILIIS